MKTFAFAALLFLGTVAGLGQAVPSKFLGVHAGQTASWPIVVPVDLFQTLDATERGNQILEGANPFNLGETNEAMRATKAQRVAAPFTLRQVPLCVVHDNSDLPVGRPADGTKRNTTIDGPEELIRFVDSDTTDDCTVTSPHRFLGPTVPAWMQIAIWLTSGAFTGPITRTVSGVGRICTSGRTAVGGDYDSGQFASFDIEDETAPLLLGSTFTRKKHMSPVITTAVTNNSTLLSNRRADYAAVLPATNLSSTVH
jgi:hypothetical protein